MRDPNPTVSPRSLALAPQRSDAQEQQTACHDKHGHSCYGRNGVRRMHNARGESGEITGGQQAAQLLFLLFLLRQCPGHTLYMLQIVGRVSRGFKLEESMFDGGKVYVGNLLVHQFESVSSSL